MESLPYTESRERLVVDALRRYVVLILVVGAVTAGAAAYFLASQPHRYTGESRVLVRATTGNALSPDSATSGQRVTVAMVTESALVDSPVVATEAAKQIGVSVEQAVRAVTASVPANTQLVEIQYTAGSPELAQKGAQKFADAYLAYRKGLTDEVVKTQLATLAKQRTEVSANLKAAGTAAAITDAKPDANAQVQLYAGRLATIENNIAAADATDINPGSVVTPALLPRANSSIINKVLVPGGAILGLLLGFVAALLLVRRDDRIRGASEHRLYGAPVLAAISGKPSMVRRLSDGGDDPVSESYRRARAGILATQGAKGQVLAVLGAAPGIPVADVALNLGGALARSGYRTAVVDGTAGWEDLGTLTGTTAEYGLHDLLRSPGDLTVVPNPVRGIELVTAGEDAALARDLFHSEGMTAALSGISKGFDLSLVAGASVTTAEGSGVALNSDGVILVAEDRRTTHAAILEAMQRCAELHAIVIGVIVVPAHPGGRRTRAAGRSSTGSPAPKTDVAEPRETARLS